VVSRFVFLPDRVHVLISNQFRGMPQGSVAHSIIVARRGPKDSSCPSYK